MSKVDIDILEIKHRLKMQARKGSMMLKSEITKDCELFVPFRDGFLKNSANASIGSDEDMIIYKAPYAKFQYYGKVMVGVKSKSAWAHQGEIKEVINKKLTYSRPTASARWFERAKSLNIKKWLKIVKGVFK